MKKLLRILLLTTLLAVPFSPIGLTGCKSPTHAAYVATTATTQTADAAIGAFDAWSQTHPVPVDDLLAVRRAALAYKAAVDTARIAQRAYATARGSAAEKDTKARLDSALDAIGPAIQSVTEVIYRIAPELERK